MVLAFHMLHVLGGTWYSFTCFFDFEQEDILEASNTGENVTDFLEYFDCCASTCTPVCFHVLACSKIVCFWINLVDGTGFIFIITFVLNLTCFIFFTDCHFLNGSSVVWQFTVSSFSQSQSGIQGYAIWHMVLQRNCIITKCPS